MVDRGCIMGYKGICTNCNGNGYVKIKDKEEHENVHQCWMCESQGELKWTQAQVDSFIYNQYFRKRVQ